MFVVVKKVKEFGKFLIEVKDRVVVWFHFVGKGTVKELHHKIEGIDILFDFIALCFWQVRADLQFTMLAEPI